MNEDLLNKFKRLHGLLGKLDSLIPEDEGAVRLIWCSDGSGRMTLELWGCVLAQTYSDDGFFYVDSQEAECYDEDTQEEVENLVKQMNETIQLEDS